MDNKSKFLIIGSGLVAVSALIYWYIKQQKKNRFELELIEALKDFQIPKFTHEGILDKDYLFAIFSIAFKHCIKFKHLNLQNTVKERV